jgi:hypothetical protein
MTLPLLSLRLDFQGPECLDPETVHKYVIKCVIAAAGGEPLVAVRVYFDGENYWLADGFHRVRALEITGATSVEAEVVMGTYAELEADWQQYFQA